VLPLPAMAKEKIGILGTGDVGAALGNGFLAEGHEVMMGSREAKNEKAAAWAKKSGGTGKTGTFADAAKFGDVVVLATVWAGTENALKMAGPDALTGKVLIDVTNPLDFSGGMPPKLAVGRDDSGGERVQKWAPKAKVVKCWNTVGNPYMYKPQLPGGPPDMFICGNDKGAKATVTKILESFGWPAIDIGGIEGSRELEPMCILWVKIFAATGSGDHAFKLLRKKK
jgi:predicted dinucleotide-binding enzyme